MVIKSRPKTTGFAVGSTADIAFLLLSFFIVITTMGTDSGLGLTLPTIGQPVVVTPSNVLAVYVNRRGEILANEKLVPLEDLPEILQTQSRSKPQLIVSIKTHRSTPYHAFVAVLDITKQSGIRKISIAEPD